MSVKCEKRKVYSGVFCITFFAFRISQHFTPGSAFARKLKGLRGLFFRSINKTRNSHEMRKYIVSVSYFVVYYAKTFAKYPQNAKYEKCIASLIWLITKRTPLRFLQLVLTRPGGSSESK